MVALFSAGNLLNVRLVLAVIVQLMTFLPAQAEDKTKLTLESPFRLGVPIDDMLLGYVARTGVIVATRDASTDPRFNAELVMQIE